MDLYESIKKVVAEKGTSINKLEIECGMPRSSIVKFKNSSPSIDKIVTLANALNCSVDYLITGEKPEIPVIDEDDFRLIEKFHKITKEQQTLIMNMIDQFITP